MSKPKLQVVKSPEETAAEKAYDALCAETLTDLTTHIDKTLGRLAAMHKDSNNSEEIMALLRVGIDLDDERLDGKVRYSPAKTLEKLTTLYAIFIGRAAVKFRDEMPHVGDKDSVMAALLAQYLPIVVDRSQEFAKQYYESSHGTK